MSKLELINLEQERELNQQIDSLATEQETPNKLWPKIEEKITQSAASNITTGSGTAKWIPWAVAASLIVSIGSIVFSLSHLKDSKNLNVLVNSMDNIQPVSSHNIFHQVVLMDEEYKQAKVVLMSNLSEKGSQFDKALIIEIEETLYDIRRAIVTLKEAIKKQPDNHHLPVLLKTTYQQEIMVLTQLVKINASI